MLHQKIVDDLKVALKSGDSFKTNTLRFLLSSLHNKEIEKKGKGLEPELTDEEVIEVLTREAKKRKEAAELYSKGNRNDLAEKELKEFEFIKQYLPEQLNKKEIEKIIKTAIEKTGAKDVKDFGLLMGEAMKELKGKADASLVSEIVKKRLAASD